MLSAHQITKNYGIYTVLQDITFSINAGERVGLPDLLTFAIFPYFYSQKPGIRDTKGRRGWATEAALAVVNRSFPGH
jgi:hypothetical protein